MARTNAKDKCRGQCKGQMPRTNAKDKCPRQIMVLWMVKKHVKGIQNQTKPIWPHSNVWQSAKNVNLLKIDKDGWSFMKIYEQMYETRWTSMKIDGSQWKTCGCMNRQKKKPLQNQQKPIWAYHN